MNHLLLIFFSPIKFVHMFHIMHLLCFDSWFHSSPQYLTLPFGLEHFIGFGYSLLIIHILLQFYRNWSNKLTFACFSFTLHAILNMNIIKMYKWWNILQCLPSQLYDVVRKEIWYWTDMFDLLEGHAYDACKNHKKVGKASWVSEDPKIDVQLFFGGIHLGTYN